MTASWCDVEAWAKAAADERYYWEIEKVDQELVDAMRGTFPDSLIWRIATQYDAIRTFPKSPNRPQFVAEFRRLADHVAEAGDDDGFDVFVRACRDLADFAKKHLISEQGSTRRPLSGVSKVLWHRQPTIGFIFDTNAFVSLKRAGLLGDYHQHLARWGGYERGGEQRFLQFAAGYRNFFLPLHKPISHALASVGRDTRRASRIVDKLLWDTDGRMSPNEADRVIANAAVSAVRATWPSYLLD